ncbi:MAG TPA: TetR/AcrR family transcriptional regulator [Phytomonospora sp.]
MSKQSPLPWMTPAGRDTPARERLSVDAIVDASYVVLNRDGLDKLSMRAVAAELGVAVSSLYTHVANKDELLRHIWIRSFIATAVPEPTADRDEWAARMRQWAHSIRDNLRRHRDLARVSAGQAPFAPDTLPYLEKIIAFFRSVGLPEPIMAAAGDHMSTFIEGFVHEEQVWEERMRGLSEQEREGVGEAVARYFGDLDPDDYPNLAAMGPMLMEHAEKDERFERGVDILIRGLLSYL